MTRKKLGLGLFILGAVFVHFLVTIPFLLAMAGVSLPFMFQSSASSSLPPSVIIGYAVQAGAVLMVVGGLIYRPREGR